MPYAKPLLTLLAGTVLLAPLPAFAQSLPRMPSLPSLPSLPGADRNEDERPARNAPSPRNAPRAAAQGNNRELIREFMLETQMLANQINTSTVTEADNQRIDREVEAYRARAQQFAGGRFDAIPQEQRAPMLRGLELHYDSVARSTQREIEFAQGMISGIGRGDAAYNAIRVHDTYLEAAALIFPDKPEYASARAQTQAALDALGGTRAGAEAAEDEAELAAARNVRMPAATSSDPGLQSLFRRAWGTSGIDWQIMRINVTSGWRDKVEYGRVVGQLRDAAIAARDPNNPDRCNLYDFTMLRDTSGSVRRSSHSTRRIACENVPG